MKQLIFGVAMVILCSMFLVFQNDDNTFIREYEKLKYVADEISNSGAIFKDLQEYSEGKLTFNYIEGNKAIDYQLKKLLKLDNSFIPLSGYWRDKIHYKVYYFDNSNMMKVYEDGNLVEQTPFTFNYLFKDKDTEYTKLIVDPTVVVTINAGRPRFRLSFLNDLNRQVIRSSAYEWKGRN